MSNQMQPNEIFIAFVSKFSQACHKIMPTLAFLGPFINLKVVEVDNPKIRSALTKSNKISSVPALMVLTPAQKKMQIFEGMDCVNLINKMVTEIQQHIAAQQQAEEAAKKRSGKTSIADVIDKSSDDAEPEEIESVRATMGDRNMRRDMPQKGVGHKDMAISTLPDGPRAAQISKMTEPLVKENPRQLKAPPQAEMLDDFDYSGGGDEEEEAPRGLSREEILGMQGASVGRESAQKSSSLHKRAQEMAKERGIEA